MASPILERILADVKDAMKAQDKPRLEALRFLHSEIKNLAINAPVRREPTDEDALTVIARLIKGRQEAIEQFRAGGRQDLVDSETFQIEVFRKYQPQQLSEADVEKLVGDAIRESGAKGKKDMGAVMKVLMPRVKGKADGKLVNAVVSRMLP
jgi:hypothetical protein